MISVGVTWLHTVAGPMIVTPFSSAILIILLVWASGMPSAMMAIVWIWKSIKIRDSYVCSDLQALCKHKWTVCLFYLWVLHSLHCAVEGWPQWSKADQDIHLSVLLHGVGHVLKDWKQNLFVAPVELLLVITTGKTKCRDNSLVKWKSGGLLSPLITSLLAKSFISSYLLGLDHGSELQQPHTQYLEWNVFRIICCNNVGMSLISGVSSI